VKSASNQSGENSDANHGSLQKEDSPTAQALHENLPRMRSAKRAISHQMPKMPQQKPPMEKTRACQIKSKLCALQLLLNTRKI
jgi:hypothetical protein